MLFELEARSFGAPCGSICVELPDGDVTEPALKAALKGKDGPAARATLSALRRRNRNLRAMYDYWILDATAGPAFNGGKSRTIAEEIYICPYYENEGNQSEQEDDDWEPGEGDEFDDDDDCLEA